MGFDVRTTGDVVILSPKGDLYGGKETDQIEEKILELDHSGNRKLLINLGKTTYMNTLGLVLLFMARTRYAKRGATVKLCCLDRHIWQIFVLVKLTLVYGDDVHQTEDEALESFRYLTVSAGAEGWVAAS